ncbi:MAG: arabinan endo-1,5-alpha-L-arabinosidase [Spirochaetaceae bacterium]|jgi:arabinan endo-1,5-alpha-L-arabinosidase|nr:arabinan endo-1,5-alpha-L-arabinosidase [Spirochaetaceae bacterium]
MRKSIVILFFVILLVLLITGCISYGNRDKSNPINLTDRVWELQGDLSAHDPVVIRQVDKWFVFYTGNGIKMKSSEDGILWGHYGQVLKKTPDWVKQYVPGAGSSIWAPDISFVNGKYHLYYSVSTFGKNNSVIGLLTNRTLDKKDSHYKWEDQGLVIRSKQGDSYNCIDPNLIIDESGEPWLTFGSFWSGIKIIKLDKKTMKPETDAELEAIAARPGSTAIEAPFIIFRNGYYYLFVSFDSCCQGVQSTYKIAVGRATVVNGSYVDKSGKSMLKGGGTIIRESDERWKGTGHNAVYTYNDQSILIYHAYDAENNGFATLRIESIYWDEEGWPYLE